MFYTVLNGRLKLQDIQPRSPEDGLWLAASIPNLPANTEVLDAACGNGLVGLALLTHQPHLRLTMLDINPTLTAQAEANTQLNNLQATITTANLLEWQTTQKFPHILCNPPFYNTQTHTPAQTETKQQTKHLSPTEFQQWLTKLISLLTPQGKLHLILHPGLLPTAQAFAQSKNYHLQTTPTKTPKRLLLQLTKT